MSDDSETTLEVKGLDQLIRMLGKPLPETRVGILGSKAGPHYAELKPGQKPPKDIPTNAEVGAVHEFGGAKTTMRSFLRGPLTAQLDKALEKADFYEKKVFEETAKEGTLVPLMKRVALIATKVVVGAFESNGYGTWKPSQMDHKKVHQTLVETQQLMRSITSEVKGGGS